MVGAECDPLSAAEGRELQASVLDAVHRLDDRYRRVLEPYLCSGETPDQIARRLEIAPGTVRAQIHRGLLRLRKVLPAGIGAGLIGISSRGLEGVRVEVLRYGSAATSVAGKVTIGAAGGVALLGGVLVMKKAILVGAAALAAAAGLLWIPSSAPVLSDREVSAPERIDDVDAALLAAPTAAVEAVGLRRESVSPAVGTVDGARSGGILVSLSVKGVAEEHLDGLVFKMTRRRSRAGVLKNASTERREALLKLDAIRQLFEDRTRGIAVNEADRDAAARELDVLSAEEESLTGATVSLSAFEDEALTAVARRVTGDGSDSHRRPGSNAVGGMASREALFEIDASEILLSDGSLGVAETLDVEVSHALYFEGTSQVDLGAALVARARQGESVRVKASVTLDPAAVLVGNVKIPSATGREAILDRFSSLKERLHEQEGLMAASRQVMVPNEAPSESLQLELQATEKRLSEIVISLDQMGALVASHASVGLFRPGDREPVGRARASGKDGFRIKLREEGRFVLVAVAAGWAVEQIEVDLRLGEEVRLPTDLELSAADSLTGTIDDFGLFPRGGLPLEVTRVATAMDQPIDWMEGDLIWSSGQVVRRRVKASSLPDGAIAVRGLSPGHHRIGLASSVLCAFDKHRRESLSVDIPVPSVGAVIALPVSVLELSVEWPKGEKKSLGVELLVGASQRSVGLRGRSWMRSSQAVVFTDPGTQTLLSLRAPGLVFEPWSGTAPARGSRGAVSIIGRVE